MTPHIYQTRDGSIHSPSLAFKGKIRNIWFTSDTHFYHHNIIHHSNRPFANVDEMNAAIIERWNSKVDDNDIVYHLGDFSMRDDADCLNVLNLLRGRKHLIVGNHDRKKIVSAPQWETVNDMLTLRIDDRIVVLFHYPIETWLKKHYESHHYHGHCHHTLKRKEKNRIDVGVDGWNFSPISFHEIQNFFENENSTTLF